MTSYLGSNLKFLRRLKGLSQQKLADAVQLKRNNIASYESGVVEPKAFVFLRLAQFFDVAPIALLTEDLTIAPLPQLAVEEEAPSPPPEIILNQLEAFIKETSDMQRLIDGFRELQKFKAAQQKNANYPDDLIDILAYLLRANWNLIHNLQELTNKKGDTPSTPFSDR